MLGLASAIFSLIEQTLLPRNESNETLGLLQPDREALKAFGKAAASLCQIQSNSFREFFREVIESDPQPVTSCWRAGTDALLFSIFFCSSQAAV